MVEELPRVLGQVDAAEHYIVLRRRPADATTPPARSPHTGEFLVLSLLSSDWELKYFDQSTCRPMKVDWARVWQR